MLDHVVLGLLAERPMHGYQLKRALSPALDREQQINDGILYPLLARLHRDGLVRKRTERAGKRPARHVYEPTAKGRRELERWLRSEEDEHDRVTYDFLTASPFLSKLTFLTRLPPAERRRKIAAQRERAREKLAELRRIRAGMVERGADPLRVSILDLGISQQRAKVRWLGSHLREPASLREGPRLG